MGVLVVELGYKMELIIAELKKNTVRPA